MAETLTGYAAQAPIDVRMVASSSPGGMYLNIVTAVGTTNQSYIGGVWYTEDASTKAAGTSYGIRFRHTVSGTQTGGTNNAVGVRLAISGASTTNNALSIYTSLGEVVTDSLRGIYMYMDTCTTVPSSLFYGLDMGVVGTGLSSVGSFIRMYNHGTDAMLSVFTLDNAAQDIATNLFIFGAADQLPLSASSSGEAVVQKIACLVGGATRYMHLHSQ